jgi:hypothetical protein
MLRPYVCVACEKVIIAADTSIPSLISLFSKITISPPTGTEIPRDAVSPKEWAVFSIWDPEPGDEHLEYELCTEILYPDGTRFGTPGRIRIPIQPNHRAQMVVSIMGFPIGQPGEHRIRTWVELRHEIVVGPIEFGIGLEVHPAAAPSAPTR